MLLLFIQTPEKQYLHGHGATIKNHINAEDPQKLEPHNNFFQIKWHFLDHMLRIEPLRIQIPTVLLPLLLVILIVSMQCAEGTKYEGLCNCIS